MVIDACSIILLSKATVLERVTEWKTVIVSQSVYNEVIEGKDKKFIDALLLEKLVSENKISLQTDLNLEVKKKLVNDFGLGEGEAESITIALDEKDKIIVTDNKQGRKASKIYGLNLVGSIELIVSLSKLKKITKEKAMSALETLRKAGWFQDHLIEKALGDIENG